VRSIRVVLKRWRIGRIIVSIGAVWLVWGLLDGPLDVPGRDSIAADVWPLAPVFLALAIADSATCFSHETERTASRTLRGRKLAHVCLAGASVLALSVITPAGAATGVVIRNAGFLVGLGYLLLRLLSRPYALLTIAMVPPIMWIMGTQPPGVAPADWAILLHPKSSIVASTASAAAVVLGIATLMHESTPEVLRIRTPFGSRTRRP